MTTAQSNYSLLLETAAEARKARDAFDWLWSNEPERRPAAHYAYFLRHAALLNAWDNFLFIFCSQALWDRGGIGAWSTQAALKGPMKPISNSDQIDKIIDLLRREEKTIKSLLNLYTSKTEQAHLLYEIAHIRQVTVMLKAAMEEIQD